MIWRTRAMRILGLLVLLAGVIAVASSADARKRHRTRHVANAPYVEKHAAIILDGESGNVLYERMANETRYPASLTKMMTLYLLFDAIQSGRLSLSTYLTASPFACAQDPTKLGLRSGDQISVEDAIKALIVRSANDVAVVVAEHLAGNEYSFAARMTAKARELGMSRTTFTNASGLPDTSQRSTAWDLALLSRRLVADFPQFHPYFRMQSFVWNSRSFEGHNNLMKFFDGADGLKTGYTRLSGYNLAASATRRGTRLIGVVMGGRSARHRDVQMAELLEAEFGRLGLGRPAPVIMAMSPLVMDDEEALAMKERERAADSKPQAVQVATAAAPPANTVAPTPPVYAGMAPVRDVGQGDTEVDQQQATRADLTAHGQWGIQVGAHATRDKAEAQLRQVRRSQRDLVAKAKSAIVALDVRGETFYRVRFGAFTPAKAEALCDKLQKRGVSCLLVTDGAWDVAASRATLPLAAR